jgi:riboflavin kinase/FMN adenylyltransferase
VKLIRNLDDLPPQLRGGAVTIGNFDGVHRGHARIVERLIAKARELDGPALVFTFDPHPVRLLRPEAAPPPLTWTDRKAQLLSELGVDSMIAYPTDEALLALSPDQFFNRIVRQQLSARAMVEGPNFFFGRNREGNIDVLGRLCQDAGVSLDVVEPLVMGDEYVSSSRVRKLIQQGHVAEARELLTHPYRIRGMVTHGDARGAKIGFPTANVDAIDTLLPAEGVYAGRAFTGGSMWLAAINLGPNPTFGEHALKVEVHLIDFDGSLYGQPLEVDFLARIRDIRPFPSVDELKRQLTRDVATARETVMNWERPSGQ